MPDIKVELQKVTGCKPKKDELEQTYLFRLHEAVQALEEDDWKALTEPAQAWANTAAKAVTAEKAIPEFATDEEGEGKGEQEGEVEEKESETTERKSEKKRDRKSEKKVEKKVEKKSSPESKKDKPESKKDKPDKVVSMRRFVKRMVVKKPSITVEAMLEKLKADGRNPSKLTVASIRASMRDAMKVLKEAGYLEEITL